jgi:MFS family permease
LSRLEIDKLSKFFFYATLFNFIVAVAITTPIIVPEFTFPLVLTDWPGTWIFIAYFLFLIVAVLGSLGWAVLLDMMKRRFNKEYVNRYMAEAHLTLSYIGIYGQTSLMFIVGYTGGYAALLGYGKATITQGVIGWMVVPIGVFIFLFIIGTVIGVANLLLALTSPSAEAAKQTGTMEPRQN